MTATAHYHQKFGQRHVDDLRRVGLTTCKSVGMYDDAMLMIEGVKQLITLDPVQQALWAGDIVHEDQKDDGLLPPDQHTDQRRRLFHYTRHLPGALVRNGVDLRHHNPFLEACERLCVRIEQLAAPAYAGLGVGKPAGPLFLRCILYEGQAEAAGHFDRNAVSAHIAETHPGLLVAEDDDFGPGTPRFRRVERTADDTVHLFLGAKMAWASDGALPALWHGADARIPPAEVRGIVVAFHHGDIPHSIIPAGEHMKRRGKTAQLIREYRQRGELALVG